MFKTKNKPSQVFSTWTMSHSDSKDHNNHGKDSKEVKEHDFDDFDPQSVKSIKKEYFWDSESNTSLETTKIDT